MKELKKNELTSIQGGSLFTDMTESIFAILGYTVNGLEAWGNNGAYQAGMTRY